MQRRFTWRQVLIVAGLIGLAILLIKPKLAF